MRVRVATFNLENLDVHPDAREHFAARCAVLRPQLEALDADVLLLQEVRGQRRNTRTPRALFALDELLGPTRYASFHRCSTVGPKGTPVDLHNLVTLSRWPLAATRQILHDRVQPLAHRLATRTATTREAIRWDRPILHARVTLPNGRVLDVLNLHLRAPLAASIEGEKLGPFAWRNTASWAEGLLLASVKRAGQALETRLVVEELLELDDSAGVIVGGDFNADLHETPVKLIMASVDETGNAKLAPRVLLAAERRVDAAHRYTVLHDGRTMLLDHVLLSAPLDLKVREVHIANEGLQDEVRAPNAGQPILGSAHAPIVVELAL